MNRILAAASLAVPMVLSGIGPVLAEGDAALGETAFRRCSACHSTTDQRRSGPALGGVFERAAGTVEGARYSEAMTSSGLVWDEATLDAFLAGPRDLVPGTTKTVSVARPEDRLNLIAYLKTLTN